MAIINEKIEGFLENFTENQQTFKDIQMNYSGNKKISELIEEILNLILGGGVAVKSKTKSEKGLIDVNKLFI